mmetsp:Transcript_6747/g.20567  ORF Transcript_6747/g.20567 Transcript_6747/m.20567 type:complete len:94 (+) Transcript_6747:793-1074(+)
MDPKSEANVVTKQGAISLTNGKTEPRTNAKPDHISDSATDEKPNAEASKVTNLGAAVSRTNQRTDSRTYSAADPSSDATTNEQPSGRADEATI